MYEVELKLPADLPQVRRRLRDRGATEIGTVTQVDTYYDHPSRSFASTDEALRIRTERSGEDATATVTYKGQLLETESKTRRELETEVAEPDVLDSMLRELGFDPVADVRKERERYELVGFTVTLDQVEGVGQFVEVEDTASKAEIDQRQEAATELVAELGLDPASHRQTSYLELLLESGNN